MLLLLLFSGKAHFSVSYKSYDNRGQAAKLADDAADRGDRAIIDQPAGRLAELEQSEHIFVGHIHRERADDRADDGEQVPRCFISERACADARDRHYRQPNDALRPFFVLAEVKNDVSDNENSVDIDSCPRAEQEVAQQPKRRAERLKKEYLLSRFELEG